MNRYTIEKRDRELVEKFRTVVASKERQKKMARIRLLVVVLLIAGAGLMFLSRNSTLPPAPEKVMNKSNRVALNRTEDVRIPLQKDEEVQAPTEDIIGLSEVSPELYPQPLVPEIQSAELVIPDKNTTDVPVPVLKPRVQASGKIGISEIPKQISAKTDIRIAEIITCLGVKNKNALSPQKEFSLQKGATPYVWMDVRSKKTPYKLRHIYYLNGRRYCAVPLAIHYPRMRTWSNVTLRHPYETGNWRVDVVSKKGEVLSQVEFTIVP